MCLSLTVQPCETRFSSFSQTTQGALTRQRLRSTATSSVAVENDLSSSRSPSISTCGRELCTVAVPNVHPHGSDSTALQRTASERVATSQAMEASRSIDRAVASKPSSEYPTREDPSRSSFSDCSHDLRERRTISSEGQIVYELDGGVRLAGGPQDIADEDCERPPLAILTFPPPYQRY